ncbi:divalent-cation tolerance protein CutA [bacterium]|jgi:periplasmic divalent cation tolerance protein|nr:divalent-cation tolerance protein CutA [bacterium]
MYFQVETSCDDKTFAKELGREIIQRKLGACVQIKENVESIYSWEGKIESEVEVLISIKTIEPRINLLIRFIKEKHTYDTPQIVAIRLEKLDAAYKSWIDKSLS